MNLFIDTNIFLSFYHLSSDDLEELKKLSVLLDRGDVTLYLTEQVEWEFWRNRENKIADALKKLKEQRLNLQFPQLCKGYEEYDKMRELQRRYEEQHAALLKKIIEDANKHNLKADHIIKELFEKSKRISIDDNLINKSKFRIHIGNPPGKKGSLGDAINWEALLKEVPNGEDLHFITDDKDYKSNLDNEEFNEFLIREWRQKKDSNIYYYKQISSFFRKHFPHIKLATELEKELLIKDLAMSSSFAQTHKIVAKLSKHSDFTATQRNEIVDATISNNQIYWILGDDDIYQFVKSIIEGYENQIDQDKLKKLKDMMKKVDEEREDRVLGDIDFLDDIPF